MVTLTLYLNNIMGRDNVKKSFKRNSLSKASVINKDKLKRFLKNYIETKSIIETYKTAANQWFLQTETKHNNPPTHTLTRLCCQNYNKGKNLQ